MSELPKGWCATKLGQLIEFKYGKALPDRVRSGSGFAVYGSNGIVGYHDQALTNGTTIIIGRKGSVGEINYSELPCSPIDTTYFIDRFSTDSPRYWFYQLKILKLGELNKATAIPGLNRLDAYNQDIALAPVNEQKRIADKLDSILARVDACRERLDRIPVILKRFRQAVLAAATSGKLTEDWRDQNPQPSNLARNEVSEQLELRRKKQPVGKKFKEPQSPDMTYWNNEIPSTWSIESVSAYAECLDYLRIPVTREKRSNTKRLYPYYGANGQVDMVDEYLFDDELVLVTEDETFYGREKPIAYRTSRKCWVNNHAHVLRTGNRARADYLCFCLMFYNVLPWLTGTTGRAKLTQSVLNSLPIAIPVQAETEEIVRRVEELFACADRIESRYHAARAQVDKLTPAILAKTFRGELVPQDPNDEPASVLLDRIRASRAENAVAPKSKRSRTIASRNTPDIE